jgi:hypothetical protein
MNPQDPSFIQFLLQALRQGTMAPQPPSPTPDPRMLGTGLAGSAAQGLQSEEQRRQQLMNTGY